MAAKGVDVIGFDACLMGMLETAYELKDVANYMIASPELEPGAGWDYQGFLSSFAGSAQTELDLCQSVIDAYAAYYSGTPTTTLAAYDLSTINALYAAFENYVADLNGDLWNSQHELRADTIFYAIYGNVEPYETSFDWHLDIWELADKRAYASSAALKTALENSVVYEWHHPGGTIYTGNPNSHGMAVYFGSLYSDGQGGYIMSYRTDYTSSSNLFNAGSSWPQWLIDLYSFPHETWLTWIEAGVVYSPGTNIAEGDGHWYQFYLESSGQISITLSNFGSEDLDLYLCDYYDGQFHTLAYSFDSNPEQIQYTLLKTGWYYICVYHYAGNPTSYNLLLTSQGAGIR